MSDGRDLLMHILNCGFLDLPMLEGEYDWCDVLDMDDLEYMAELRKKGEVVLNFLLQARVIYGLRRLESAIDKRITELVEEPLAEDQSEEEAFAELKKLEELFPFDDIHDYYNCIDTHVWFYQNEKAYRKYLPEAIEEFERGTGLILEERS